MKCNQNNNNDSKEIVSDIKTMPQLENLNNLYTIIPQIRRQIRWFKGSRDRGLKSDIAA